MPDSKITALASIGTGTDPAVDPLVIVDVSDTTMAASGTTKKVTLNNLLACSPTATLASATITGDLTVDTNTLKVDSVNNRVGVLTASPVNTLHVNGEVTLPINNLQYWNAYYSSGFKSVAAGYAGYTAFATNGDFVVANTDTSAAGAASALTFYNRYRISNAGIHTWEYVGGVAGTAMTLNSTGLGIGVTPSAWNTIGPVLQIEQASLVSESSNQLYLSANAYFASGNWNYINNSQASQYYQSAGSHVWRSATASTGTISFSTLMTLESTGSLVLGAAAVATTATDGFLYIPGCAGTPTGTPTAKTGRVPLVVDTTNNKLYFYSGGAWVAAN